MASNPKSTFETSMDKTNLILKDIEQAYGWPRERRNQSYLALRTVLHLLRDRLPVEESAQFAAQLPMVVRGVYYEGWDPTVVPVKLNREDFLYEVRRNFTFDIPGGTEQLVRTVLQALRKHVTEGEWNEVRDQLPKSLTVIMS